MAKATASKSLDPATCYYSYHQKTKVTPRKILYFMIYSVQPYTTGAQVPSRQYFLITMLELLQHCVKPHKKLATSLSISSNQLYNWPVDIQSKPE